MFSINHLVKSVSALFLVLAVSIPATAAQWEKLGQRSVKRGVDKDVMHVTIANGGFRQLKIAVKKSPVNIKKIIVEYANGKRDELKLRSVISAGSESRLMDLRGGKRVIRKVTFYYETIERGRGKAIVTAWGRRGV
ncbi:hypothetical protein [Shewanella sp. 10N.286.54.B9]|uniref:DUF2541 family protein n=1 Tax=Shewanella sp. 10N.286.54.B9 TaxID=3229719 RepID=UPI00354DD5A0